MKNYIMIQCVLSIFYWKLINSWAVLDTELENSLNPGACDRYLRKIHERHIKIIKPAKLKGTWVSSGCETRPGPEYIIRKYHFLNDTYFSILQFYYTDASCTHPFYGLEAKGILKMKDHFNDHSFYWDHSSAELIYTPTIFQVSVMPYSIASTRHLQNEVVGTDRDCRAKFSNQVWHKNNAPFYILSFVEYKNRILRDFDCTAKLGFNLNEFQLIRVEHRTAGVGVLKQLHLGNIATVFTQRHSHRPSSFQEPLQEIRNIHCKNCYNMVEATLKNPPILQLRAMLTTYPSGEWVSVTCESRPHKSYVTRRLVFEDDSKHTWSGTYNHYHDPFCREPFFSFTAKGHVKIKGLYKSIYDSRKFDFQIKELLITPRNKKSKKQFNGYKGYGCGRRRWEINVTQDVTDTNGCEYLQLVVPTTSEEIMSTEFSRSQNWLYVGAISDSIQQFATRPTSYQPPLVKCRNIPMPYITNKKVAISDMHYSSEYMNKFSVSLTASAYLRQALLVCFLLVIFYSNL